VLQPFLVGDVAAACPSAEKRTVKSKYWLADVGEPPLLPIFGDDPKIEMLHLVRKNVLGKMMRNGIAVIGMADGHEQIRICHEFIRRIAADPFACRGNID
jgi:hypothetical protein